MDTVLLLARFGLAAVFLVAAVAKFVDMPGSRVAMRDMSLPSPVIGVAAVLLPVVEVVLAASLMPASTARWGAGGALVLLLGFITAITVTLVRGRRPSCHCFGQLSSGPVGPRTVIRNIVFAVAAGMIVVAGRADAGPDGWEALANGSLAQRGAVVLSVGAVPGLVAVVWRRRDSMAGLPGGKTVRGLPVGSAAPTFTFPDLEGNDVSLDQLRQPGRPLILLFTDPGCGPCRAVLRHVDGWRQAAGDRLTFVAIGRGSLAANLLKAQEFQVGRMLLMPDLQVAEAYGADGTPAGVLVRADGTIGSAVAGGYEEILELVAATLGHDVPVSRLHEDAPFTGPLPSLVLTSLTGSPVLLPRLQVPDRPMMLHIVDPQCGPCYDLFPDIGGWERMYGGRLTQVVISAQATELNIAMIEDQGISPDLVLVQRGHEVFDLLHLKQLPAAVVIDADGTIRQAPVYGAPAIRRRMADLLGLAMPAVPVREAMEIPRGMVSPVLRRPDLDGMARRIGGPSTRERVLLFWSIGCPHCEALLPEIIDWEADALRPDLLLISRGPAGVHRGLGLRSPIVLDDDRAIGQAFGVHGTPAAVVIDRRGVVSSGVIRGAGGVRALVTRSRDMAARLEARPTVGTPVTSTFPQVPAPVEATPFQS